MHHSFDIYHVILILTSLIIYNQIKKILECINVKLNNKITKKLFCTKTIQI